MAGNTSAAITALSGTNAKVKADNQAPSVVLTSAPISGAYTNGTQLLDLTVSDLNANITEAKIGAANSYATFAGTKVSDLNGWNSVADGNTVIYIRHTDKAGNVTTVSRSVVKTLLLL